MGDVADPHTACGFKELNPDPRERGAGDGESGEISPGRSRRLSALSRRTSNT